MPTHHHVEFLNQKNLIPNVEVSRSASLNMTVKPKSARPSFKSRWKSFRASRRKSIDRNNRRNDDGGGGGGKRRNSPAEETGFYFMESFSMDSSYHEDELSVKICKETIRQNLLDQFRLLKGNDFLLQEMELKTILEFDIKQLEALNDVEKNMAFLWASFITKLDYMELLYELGANITYKLEREGFNGMHLSAFTGCTNCVRWLIRKGCDINVMKDTYTPLHYAVLGNSLSTAQLLIQEGCLILNTVLHAAVLANAIDCVYFLINTPNININNDNNYDQYGMTALHIAADRGMYQCLKIIIDSITNIDIKTIKRKSSSLHLAAESGYTKCVTLLIDKGANVNECNYKGQTALHLSAKAQSLECVEVLLKEGANVNIKDVDNRTPLHAAVCKPLLAYPITELLVKWDADVNVKDHSGYCPLHIAALNELSQCVDLLIMKGANVVACTKGGISALSIINRKIPTSIEAIKRKLDESLSFNDAATETGTNREAKLKLDFRYILQNSNCGEIGFLQTLQKEGYKEMLEHPLCMAFLHLKWEKVRRFYFLRLFLCSIFVLFLSTYVMTALAHECYNQAMLNNHNNNHNVSKICINNPLMGDKIMTNPRLIELTWYVLVFFTFIEIVRKIYSTPGFTSIKQYFLSLSNMIEWFVIVSVFAVSCVYEKRTYIIQNHIGAFAVLCGWSILMIMIGQLPLFGTYIAMFTKVQGEFAKLLLAYSCLLIGFTVSFCIMFPMEDAFNNPLIGLLKVLAMMTGELDMNNLLLKNTKMESQEYLLSWSAHIIFVLFLIFVTVILMNLLVGIAVHDIEGLHHTAGLSKLVRQTELIYFLEVAFFHGYLPKKIMDWLKLTMFVSPQAYRVVLYVRPMNPREKRLPRDVMEAALKLARRRKQEHNNNTDCSTINSNNKNKKDNNNDEDRLKMLMDEMKEMKEMMKQLLHKHY